MVLKHLQRGDTKVAAMLQQAIMQHTLWQGGDQAGLGGPHNQQRGWDGLLLGRLHLWMTDMQLTLTGPDKYTCIPWGRAGDWLLTDIVGDDSAARATMAAGCWDTDLYRVSDVLDWKGELLPAACLGLSLIHL